MKKLIRKIFPAGLLKTLERIYRQGRGLLLQLRYGFPARDMRVVAVTGTNGKTTTTSYINEILKAAGYKTAVLNTVYFEVDGKRTPNATHFTIVKQSIVQSFFAQARRASVDFVVLEVTSHALDQDRIMGVKVETAVLTNLTQDHLDYHGTMDNYAAAKSKLFKDYGAKYAILNADDAWYGFFAEAAAGKVYSYGKTNTADLRISKVRLSARGSSAELSSEAGSFLIEPKLPGEYNLYNAAAAASAGLSVGVEMKHIAAGVAALKRLDGRMEEISEGQSFRVLVDFAITPDALEKALVSLRKVTAGKVCLVFGATGDRDRGKRPDMGRMAAKYADVIYLTDDETYTEDPEDIRQAVLEGIQAEKGEKKTKVIPEREEAIRQALEDAKKGDAVIITGLGHEDSRNMGGKLIPWRDQEVAKKLLKSP